MVSCSCSSFIHCHSSFVQRTNNESPITNSRRAQIPDALLWIFYLGLTMMVVLVMVVIPQRSLEKALVPIDLDAQIQATRMFYALSERSSVTGVSPGVVRADPEKAELALGNKRWGYHVFVPASSGQAQVVLVGNRQFYDEARPFADVKFLLYTHSYWMARGGETVEVKVEGLFPEKYAAFS